MRTLGLCLLALCFLAPSSVLAAKKKVVVAKKKKVPTAKQAARPKTPPKPLGPPQVIFTFDDGPAGERTVKVLDLLDQSISLHAHAALSRMNGLGVETGLDGCRLVVLELHAQQVWACHALIAVTRNVACGRVLHEPRLASAPMTRAGSV